MKKFFFRIFIVAIAGIFCAGCSDKNNDASIDNPLAGLSDSEVTALMMQKIEPDSLAKFLFLAALGDFETVQIDSLPQASLYAFENYTGEQLEDFSRAYDDFPDSQPLSRKMKIMHLINDADSMEMAYRLGIDYVNRIRISSLKDSQIEAELVDFKRACGSDTNFYNRAMSGFAVALKADNGRDIPRNIFLKYSSFTMP